MSPLEDVKTLSMENAAEMTTGLAILENVTEHAREVSTISSAVMQYF